MDTHIRKLFSKAFKGSAYAQYQLHVCYHSGEGLMVNWKKSFFWLRKSALQGYIPAIFWYAEALAEYPHPLLKRDIHKAIKLMSKAASVDFLWARNKLQYYLWLEEQNRKTNEFTIPLDELDCYEEISKNST